MKSCLLFLHNTLYIWCPIRCIIQTIVFHCKLCQRVNHDPPLHKCCLHWGDFSVFPSLGSAVLGSVVSFWNIYCWHSDAHFFYVSPPKIDLEQFVGGKYQFFQVQKVSLRSIMTWWDNRSFMTMILMQYLQIESQRLYSIITCTCNFGSSGSSRRAVRRLAIARDDEGDTKQYEDHVMFLVSSHTWD